MNKSIKFIFLVVMLAIPAMIFTFLKFFGDNRFDVEIYYQDGTEGKSGCMSVEGQFYVADSLLESGSKVHVVLFNSDNEDIEESNFKARLLDTFDDEIAIVIYVKKQSDGSFTLLENFENIVSCGFLSDNSEQLVLVDGQRRIRGYYSRELDEIDRLIVETKIVVENEQRDSNR